MDHVAIAFARVKLDADGHLADDLPCFGCDYNLRTQHPDSTCPECGQGVSVSLSPDRLLFADPVWLARLKRGMVWVVVGLAWQIPWRYLGRYLGSLLAWLDLPAFLEPVAYWHGYYAGLIVMLIGWWRITSPEPRRGKVVRSDRPRRIVRTVLTLAVVGYYPSIYWYSQGSLPWDERFLLVQVVETLADLSYVLGILWAYRYLVRLAGRVPRSDLIRHARAVGWTLGGLSLLANTVFKIQVIGYVSGAFAPGTGASSLQSSLNWIAPVIAVFYTGAKLWALVLCVAYARLFRRLAHKHF